MHCTDGMSFKMIQFKSGRMISSVRPCCMVRLPTILVSGALPTLKTFLALHENQNESPDEKNSWVGCY